MTQNQNKTVKDCSTNYFKHKQLVGIINNNKIKYCFIIINSYGAIRYFKGAIMPAIMPAIIIVP